MNNSFPGGVPCPHSTPRQGYSVWEKFVADPGILFLEDDTYGNITENYRQMCDLPSLKRVKADNPALDFSGVWTLNEQKGDLGNSGISNLPLKLSIYFTENGITINKTIITEFADDRITNESYAIDGSEVKSIFWNAPRITSARWSETADTMIINSKTTFTRGDKVS